MRGRVARGNMRIRHMTKRGWDISFRFVVGIFYYFRSPNKDAAASSNTPQSPKSLFFFSSLKYSFPRCVSWHFIYAI